MLQLKISVPALSAAEAETYVNLLFADLHLNPAEFSHVLDAAKENRKTNGLSVAFNTGIAGDVLSNPPKTLTDDLGWAAEITPILGSSLRGNPRQLKRFLNNLLLKHRSAARRDVNLKLPILAKLMVLEDQYNTDFQKLFDWEMVAGGKCPEIGIAESAARIGLRDATPRAEEEASGEKPTPRKPSSTRAKTHVLTAEPEHTPTDAESWAAKPSIAEWLRAEPALAETDLRPYFTYSRDKLSFGVSASRLAPHLQQLLGNVQSDIDANRRSHYSAVSTLDPIERAQFTEALIDRVRRHPSSIAMTAVLELAELNPDMVQSACDALMRIPTASIAGATGTTAVRRLPAGYPAVTSLLDHWVASDNAALKALVAGARKTQAKKGATIGNLSR